MDDERRVLLEDEIRLQEDRIQQLEDALKISHDVALEALGLLQEANPMAVARLTERLAKIEAVIGDPEQPDLEP